MEGIVIDTNVFVAAGFNPRSASARVLTDAGMDALALSATRRPDAKPR